MVDIASDVLSGSPLHSTCEHRFETSRYKSFTCHPKLLKFTNPDTFKGLVALDIDPLNYWVLSTQVVAGPQVASLTVRGFHTNKVLRSNLVPILTYI